MTRTLPSDKLVDEAIRNSQRLSQELQLLLVYKKIVTGEGLEFDRLREYSPGDEARMIDWNSLARTNTLYTKVFEEERLLDTLIVQDVSASASIGSQETLKNEYSSIISTTLSLTATEAGDRAGFIGFSDEVKATTEMQASDESAYRIAQQLSDESVFGGETDWETLERQVLDEYSSETFLFLISDFIPFNDDAQDFLKKATEAFRGVFCFMVRDRLDSELPEGVGKAYISDPETGEKVLVDIDEIREDYNRRAAEKERKIRKTVEADGGQLLKVHTEEDFADEFAKFLHRGSGEWS